MDGASLNETRVRAIVDAWPGVGSGIKWEDDLVFTVADKMFCVLCVRGTLAGR